MTSGASRARDRAVTVQIGAVILFGFLIVALSTYQATVVPDQNAEVEFLHNQEVQQQMQDVRNGMLRTAATDRSQPTGVTLGTRYPSRAFLVNPPPATGRIATQDTANTSVSVVIENGSAVADVSGEEGVVEYWNGSAKSFNTGFVVYRPNYNLYRQAPTTTYEHGLLYNEFPSGRTLPITDQTVVDGRRISLVTVAGDISQNGVGSYTVQPTAVSTSTRTITLRNDTAPITIELPTRLENTTDNRELVAEQYGSASVDATLVDRAGSYNVISLRLSQGTTFTLSLARVGVGTAPDDTNATYLTTVDPLAETLDNGTTDEVVVEVRDEYNNPVSGVEVNTTSSANLSVSSPSAGTTGSDGRVTFLVTADGSTSDANLTVGIEDESPDYEVVRFENRTVSATGDDSVGGALNPAEKGDIRLNEEVVVSNDVIELRLNNTATSDVNITRARINFYSESQPNTFSTADIYKTGESVSANLEIGGPFTTLTPEANEIELQNQSVTGVRLEFQSNSGNARFNNDEFFIVTLVYDNGESDLYFVNVN